MKRFDKSALVFLAFGVCIVLGALNLRFGSFFRPGPGLFPLCLGILLILFSALSFFTANPPNLPKLSWSLMSRSAVYVVGVLFAYRFGLPFLGYYLSTLLLLIFLLKSVGRQRWFPSMAWSVAITATTSLIFIRWLAVPFPRGIILPF